VADPTSSEGLAAAGLLEADALLLAPDAAARSSPAEADAHVLGTMLEVQHLLACVQRPSQPKEQQQQQQPARQLGSWESRISRRFGFGRNRSIGRRKDSNAAAAAVAAAEQHNSSAAVEELPAAAPRKLHVVACVATTSATAVAASFFGNVPGTDSGNRSSSGSGSGAVVGCCPFSYELIVHGEVESAVLLQVRCSCVDAAAHRSTSGGCVWLYAWESAATGFSRSSWGRLRDLACFCQSPHNLHISSFRVRVLHKAYLMHHLLPCCLFTHPCCR
jgi:hypothetical protein